MKQFLANLKHRFTNDPEYGVMIDFHPWLLLTPPGFWLFLPKAWITFDILCQGGFWIEITDPNNIGGMGPKLMFQGGIAGNRPFVWQDER
jgi:hypothetical protein